MTIDTQAPNDITFNNPGGDEDWPSGTTNYVFDWNAPSDNGVSGLRTTNTYYIEQFPTFNCSGAPAASSYQTGLSFNYTGLTDDNVYSLRVTAYDKAGNSSTPTCSGDVRIATADCFSFLGAPFCNAHPYCVWNGSSCEFR